ncbi:MAG TPA: choice-of-anchor tandem repeat NxxGxxAF-containing protein, partial [Candidatus Binatia bacterium]|nr:choice-of-anchor tandem repeat NxxGxxAF-containing protein [Candidatus Binatia bacterium]
IARRCGGAFQRIVDAGAAAPGGGRLAGLGDGVAVGANEQVAFTAVLDDGTTGIFLADGDGTIREVTRTGAPSPAVGTFSGLRLIGLSTSGRVGFRASTSNGPDGLFYWDGTALGKLAVVGEASPAGGIFTSVGFGAMNGGDTWTFRAAVSSGPRRGVFRASTATFLPSITAVALEGDPAPGGGTFSDFPTSLVPAINTPGWAAFRATIADGPFPSGVFVALGDGTLAKVAAVGEPTSAGPLVRLRDVALADDGGVIVRATLTRGAPGLFRARGGSVEALAILGDPTDVGGGFRFSDARVGATADAAVFLGTREGIFQTAGDAIRTVALLGETTPLQGEWTGFDPPVAGGARTVFGAGIQGGRAGEAVVTIGRRRPVVLAKTGDRVGGSFKLVDVFADPLDDLARAAVAPGGVAFQAALTGGTASGIVFWNGGRLRAVARQGQSAPGGGSFREFGTPALGPGAQVAFIALGGEGTAVYRGKAGGRTRLVAAAGRDTGTRLRGVFRGFGSVAAGAGGVAFHATLDQPREGLFIARGRCTMALAGSAESEPGGGRFRTFGTPAFARRTIVFRSTLVGGVGPSALYRVVPPRGCTQVAPTVETIATAGTPSPAGATFLGFGTPATNARGDIAVAVDLIGSGPTDAIIHQSD